MSDVFDKVLADGDVRILLKIKKMRVQLTNIAPGFISLKEDQPLLVINIQNGDGLGGIQFDKYPLKIVANNNNDLELMVEEKSIWFDISTDLVSSVWSANCNFEIESKHPYYLKYHIQLLEFDLEWLQFEPRTGKIESVSVSNKEFKQEISEDNLNYSLAEIERCSDMLGRAIKKIDLRTGSAHIRLNTDNGKLEPAIMRMANKLGFELNKIEESKALNQENRGHKASHIISLSHNY